MITCDHCGEECTTTVISDEGQPRIVSECCKAETESEG